MVHVRPLVLDVANIQESLLVCIYMSKVTAPQDAHRRLVLQVYLGLNTLEFSAIHR